MSHAGARERDNEQQLKTPRWRALADKIVKQCLGIVPGEVVQLGGGVHNFDFIGALAAAVRRAGAYPELNVTSDDLQLEMLLTVPEEHLRSVPPHRLRWLEDVDAMIVTDSVSDPSRAEAVPRERRLAAHAAAEIVEQHLFDRSMRWAYVGYPTLANTAGLPVPFDEVQPIFWQAVDADYDQMASDGAALASRLEQGGEIRIVTDKGTDLVFAARDRPVLIDDGIISPADVEEGNAAIHLPAGRVMVAPVETSAAGRIVIDWAWQNGQSFAGLTLDVEQGQVQVQPSDGEAGAGDLSQARDQLRLLLDTARGDKDRIGAFAIGLNPGIRRFTGYGALDEKRRGAVHLTFGDNRLFGGKNIASLHFNLFLENATVLIDGVHVVERGNIRP